MPDEIRMVTGLNGLVRWQGRDGASYATQEEAEAATVPPEPYAPRETNEPSKWSRWLIALFLLGVGAFGVFVVYAIIKGWSALEWSTFIFALLVVFGAFMALVVGVAHLAALIRGVDHATSLEWVEKVEARLLAPFYGTIKWSFIAALVVVSFAVAYAILSSTFSGVDKGTGIIIVLLILIFFALMQIANRPAR
jgi:magnesium-transporting ATPase (P-type)